MGKVLAGLIILIIQKPALIGDSVGDAHECVVHVRNLEWPRRRMPFNGLKIKLNVPSWGILRSVVETCCNPRLDPADGRILFALIILRSITLSDDPESHMIPPHAEPALFYIRQAQADVVWIALAKPLIVGTAFPMQSLLHFSVA